MKKAIMKRCCAAYSLRLAKPVPVVAGGSCYELATDGTAALMLPNRGRIRGERDSFAQQLVSETFARRARRSGTIPLATLRHWAGKKFALIRGKELPGIVLDVVLNRRLLSRYLPPGLTDGPISVATFGENDPIRFVGNGWKLMIMPCRMVPKGRPCPVKTAVRK